MPDRPARRAVTRQTAPRGTLFEQSRWVPLKGLNLTPACPPWRGSSARHLSFAFAFAFAHLPYVVIPTEAAFWPTRDLLSPCL